MPATERQRVRFRQRLGGDVTAMPDAYIDGLFDDATGVYPDGTPSLLFAAALLEGARDLRAAALRDVDYSVNEVSEKLSQRWEHLNKLVAECEKDLAALITPAASGDAALPLAWGGLHQAPPLPRRYPGDGRF